MTDGQALIVETPRPGVLRLTFNRPATLNAYDMATFAAFDAELARAADDPEVRAIVIGARGGKAFSAGFDIHEMAGFDAAAMRAAFEARDPVFGRIAAHPLPVIAAVDGICYGAGALLALACDFRFASPAFRLKVTAVGYGSANATWSLTRAVGASRAKAILMTGAVVGAEEALACGLVNEVHPADALDRRALDFAASIAAQPPAGVADIKRLVDASLTRTPLEGWRAEHDRMIERKGEGTGGGADTFRGFLTGHDRTR